MHWWEAVGERKGALGPNYNTNHIKSIIKAVEIY